MLDQNTDRMWYVIGAVLIGAAIIFGMNTMMPNAFASVGESFKDISEKAMSVIENMDLSAKEKAYQEWLENPEQYVMATDADFTGDKNGSFRYVGSDKFVEIPHTIKGVAVTSYSYMFTNTDVKGVRSTNPNVNDMRMMFYTNSAPFIDVSQINVSGVDNMNGMFFKTNAVVLHGVEDFNTEKVTNMHRMFSETDVQELDISKYNMDNVVDLGGFLYDSKVKRVNMSSINTAKVTNFNHMFANTNLEEYSISHFNMNSAKNNWYLFLNVKTDHLDISNMTSPESLETINNMLEGTQISTVDMSGFTFRDGIDMTEFVKNAKIGKIYVKSQADANFLKEFVGDIEVIVK